MQNTYHVVSNMRCEPLQRIPKCLFVYATLGLAENSQTSIVELLICPQGWVFGHVSLGWKQRTSDGGLQCR